MRTNNKKITAAGLAMAASLPVLAAPAAQEKPDSPRKTDRPDILFILAEDMTLDLSCYGRRDVRTPNLDRLASEGVVYTNARCVAPLSSPTRSAMMTGLHHEITASHNHRSHRDQALPVEIVPFTVQLRKAGYTTVLGDAKAFENPVTHADHESSRKIDCNFRYEPVGSYDGKDNFGLFDRLYERPSDGSPWFQQITLYVTHRGDWWKDISSRSPHPVDPASVDLPPYFADHPKIREEFACYLDQVEYMDAEVGRILGELEAQGRLDSTVVIFIADNGRADIRAKGWMYNDGTRIPMIIRAPGVGHKVVDDLVSELDIPATILSLAGVERPSYYQGEVLEAFSGKPASHQWLYHGRDTWDEVQECIRAVTDERYVYVRNYLPQIPYIQKHCYTYCYRPALHIMKRLKEEGRLNEDQLLFFADSKPVEELYDYRSDTFCLRNLALEPSMLPVLNMMRERMDSWQGTYGDAGVEDHLTRKLPDDRAEYRRQMYFASRFRADEWAEIENGEICDKYDRWKAEIRQMQADNKVTLSDPIIKIGDNKQASLICDNHLVAFYNGGRAQAFSLKDGRLVSTFYLGSSKFEPHCNVADYVRYGRKGYAYVSAWDGTKNLFVEQIRHSGDKWSSTLVQTVSVSDIPDEVKGAGQLDWVPDFENGKLYTVSYKQGHYRSDIQGASEFVILEFPLPQIGASAVNFTEEDILRRAELPVYLASQDKEIHNGKMYVLAGLKNKAGLRDPERNSLRAIAVLDLATLRYEKEIRLDFYDCEPEGIEFIGDDMYLTYYKDALYKVNLQ